MSCPRDETYFIGMVSYRILQNTDRQKYRDVIVSEQKKVGRSTTSQGACKSENRDVNEGTQMMQLT